MKTPEETINFLLTAIINKMATSGNHDIIHLISIMEHIKQFKTNKSVDWAMFVDVDAFKEALEILSNENHLIGPKFEWEETRNSLTIIFSREAYDDNGFRIGYETYYIKYKVYYKNEFGNRGNIHLKDNYLQRCIVPSEFKIRIKPAERPNAHYFPADDMFVHEEYERHLKEILDKLPDMKFYNTPEEGRHWQVGDLKFYLDD